MSLLRDGLNRGSLKPSRVACLLVPDLPLRAELRAHPELSDAPFIVAAGPDSRADVLEVSAAAYRAGVRPHGSVTQARAICGELQVRVVSPALERAARQTLLDVALSFSPRVQEARHSSWAFSNEAAVLLDASGISSLFDSERHFASALGARAESVGLPGVVAIAASQSVARIAARQCAHQSRNEGRNETRNAADDAPEAPGSVLCVVPPGSEARFLGPLPIDLLDPEDALAAQLTRFGVHTVRDLLKLPKRALAQRVGPEVLKLVALAQGAEPRTPLPAPVETRIEEAIDLDYPVDRIEPLLFVLRGQISRLMERLALRQLACGPLDLRLDLAGGGQDVRQIGIASPTRDVRVLLRVISQALESRPPEGAVETVSVSTQGQPARRDQLDLFIPRGPDPNTLDQTLSELESLCGAGRVGAPEVADDHRPDAFGIKPFELRPSKGSIKNKNKNRPINSHKNSSSKTEPDSASLCAERAPHYSAGSPASLLDAQGTEAVPRRTHALALRALRPPVSAEVRVERGMPAFIRSAVANGHTLNASGPWRTTGHWWSESERYAVDHFDVQVSDGTVLRLCFDWIDKVWRIDGIYD